MQMELGERDVLGLYSILYPYRRRAERPGRELTPDEKQQVREATMRIPRYLERECKQGAMGRAVGNVLDYEYVSTTMGTTTLVPISMIPRKYGTMNFESSGKRFEPRTESTDAAGLVMYSIAMHEREHQDQITNLDMLRRYHSAEQGLSHLVGLLSREYGESDAQTLGKKYVTSVEGFASDADVPFYEAIPTHVGLASAMDKDAPQHIRKAVRRDLERDAYESDHHGAGLLFRNQIFEDFGNLGLLTLQTPAQSSISSCEEAKSFLRGLRERVGKDEWNRINKLLRSEHRDETARQLLGEIWTEELSRSNYKERALDILNDKVASLQSSRKRIVELRKLFGEYDEYRDVQTFYKENKRKGNRPNRLYSHMVFHGERDGKPLVVVCNTDWIASDDLIETFCMFPDTSIAHALYERYVKDGRYRRETKPRDEKDFINLCPMRNCPDFDCKKGRYDALCGHEKVWADAVLSSQRVGL